MHEKHLVTRETEIKKDIEIPFHPPVRMSIIKHKNKQANKQANK